MLRMTSVLVVVGALPPALTSMAAQEATPPAPTSSEIAPAAADANRDFLVFFHDQPACFFHQARIEFLDGNLYAAWDQLHRASAQIKLETCRLSDDDDNRALLQCCDELDRLGEEVLHEQLTAVDPLDRAFARAHAALADRYARLADESWKASLPLETGRYLDVLVMNIHGGRAWSHQPVDADGMRAFDEASVVAGDLMHARHWFEADVKRALDRMRIQRVNLDEIVTSLSASGVATPDEAQPSVSPLAPQDIWLAFEDEPNHLFHLVRRDIIDLEYGAAMRDLGQATAFMRLQQATAGGDAAKMLQHALAELQVVSDALDADSTIDLREVMHSFACSHLALSMYWQEFAAATPPLLDPDRAARYLGAVAGHLNRASLWSSGGLDSSALNAAWRAHDLATRMLSRKAWQTIEYEQALRDLRDGVFEAKARIEPEE